MIAISRFSLALLSVFFLALQRRIPTCLYGMPSTHPSHLHTRRALDWQGDGSKAASIAGGVVVVVVPLFFVICWCLTRARGGCSTGRSGIAPVPEV